MSLEQVERCKHGTRPAWCVVCTPVLAPDPKKAVISAYVAEGMCRRACGRPKASGPHFVGTAIGDYCNQCRKVGRDRVRMNGDNPDNDHTLLMELERAPTRGCLPGVDPTPRRDRGTK